MSSAIAETLQSNLLTENHEGLKEIIKKCYYIRKPVICVGPVGIGKSATFELAAREISDDLRKDFKIAKLPNKYPDKFCFTDYRLAQKDASDISGTPWTFAYCKINGAKVEIPVNSLPEFIKKYPDLEIIMYSTHWNSPAWLPRQGHGIILLDELFLAPRLVQNSVLEMIYDRRANEWICPEGWVVFAASNRGAEDRVFQTQSSAAMDNRFCWVQLRTPNSEQWVTWGLRNGVDPRVLGYITVHSTSLSTFSKEKKEHAFATPRTWEYVSDLIKKETNLMKIRRYTSIAVGSIIANQFIMFLKLRDQLYTPDVYINDPEGVTLPVKRDILYALGTTLADYYATHKSSKVLTSIFLLCSRIPSKEYGLFFIKLCKAVDDSFFNSSASRMTNLKAKRYISQIGDDILK